MCVLCNWWVPNRVSFRYGCSKQSSGHGQAVHISRSSSLLAQLPGSPPAVEKDSLELLVFILLGPQSRQEEHSSSLNSSASVLELMMTGLTWIICPPINPLLWAERYHTMIATGRGHVPALESGVADASHNSDPKNWELGDGGSPPQNVSVLLRRGNGAQIHKNNGSHYIHFPPYAVCIYPCLFPSPNTLGRKECVLLSHNEIWEPELHL